MAWFKTGVKSHSSPSHCNRIKKETVKQVRHSHWKVFCWKGVLLCQISILWMSIDLFRTKKLFLQETFTFVQVILLEIKTVSFSKEYSCCGARNKFRTSTFIRIFNYCNYLRENLDLPGHCKCLSVSLLRTRKNAIIFPRKQSNATKKHLSIPEK